MKQRNGKPLYVHMSDGLSAHALASTFRNMIHRCCNPDDPRYGQYGGRGIRVCERWLEPGNQGFLHFLADLGPRPEGRTRKGRPAYSLHRIDNDGPYSPANCCWANSKTQNKHKRFSTLQWKAIEEQKVRCYVVLIGNDSMLCNADGTPFITKDIFAARHQARMHRGWYVGLKEFLDRKKCA